MTDFRYCVPHKSNEPVTIVVETAVYKGYRYVIIDRGWFPLAYVEIKYRKNAKKIKQQLDVHGGVTYCDTAPFKETKQVYAGWDYGHCGDYSANIPGVLEVEKRWTLEEVREHCHNAIEQMLILEAE